MTSYKQLDQLITDYQAGRKVSPQTSEEKLAVDLIDLAASFELNTPLDVAGMAQLQQPTKVNYGWRLRIPRRIAASAAALILICLAFLTIIPLQTFAQEIIRQIGTFILTDEDPQDQPIVPANQQEGFTPVTVPDAAAASAGVGFPVYVPEYQGIGRPLYYALSTRPNDAPTYVVTDYRSARGLTILMIFQFRTDDDSVAYREFPIGDAETREVMINGTPATWIAQRWRGTLQTNDLLWEQDGFTFSMSSADLPLEEMIAIAESLTPVEPSE